MDRFKQYFVISIAIVAVAIGSLVFGASITRLSISGIDALSRGNSQSQVAAAALAVPTKKSHHLSDLATEVLRKAKQHKESASKDKKTTLANLRSSLQNRKQAMLDAAKNDPEEFLLSSLPDSVASQLPSDVSTLIEKNVEVEGELIHLHFDSLNDSEEQFILKTNKKNYSVHFTKRETQFHTGTKVKATGVALDSELVVAGDDTSNFQALTSNPTAPPSAQATFTGFPTGDPSEFGNQTTLVIMADFLDDKVHQFSPQEINGYMFTNTDSVNGFYKSVSHGQTFFTGQVTGQYLTLPYKETDGCNEWKWGDDATAMAKAAGYNTNVHHIVVMIPRVAAGICHLSWSGMSSVGGNPSMSIIKMFPPDLMDLELTIQHELGHGLGLEHASRIDCGKQMAPYSQCKTSEYGDPTDVMGSSPNRLNAPHRLFFPWIPFANVQQITTSGTYAVSDYLSLSSSTQLLMIQKPDTQRPGSKFADNYYISYISCTGYACGSSLHIWDGRGQTFVVMMYDIASWAIPGVAYNRMVDGTVYNDPINGITFKQVSHNLTSASIQITLTPPVCVPVSPSITVKPLTQRGNPGQPLAYTVAITNNDPFSCNSSTFSISATNLPSGFVTSPITATIAHGVSYTFPLIINAPAPQADGSYPFSISTSDANTPAHATSTNAAYIVYNDTQPPAVSLSGLLTGTASVVSKIRNIKVTASDDLGVTKVELYKDGSLFGSATTSPFTQSWDTSGEVNTSVHTFLAKAYDYAGNASSTALYSVRIDNTPPLVAVTSPTDGSTVSGSVAINATSSDAYGIQSMKFYVDTKLVTTDSSAPYVFVWNSASTTDSAHVVAAEALDKAGNVSTSTITLVAKNGNAATDTSAPTVSILSPLNGAIATGTAVIAATALDNLVVSKVEFWIDNVPRAIDSNAPYSYSWATIGATNASHTLQAKAYDGVGNIGVSNVITVTVANGVIVPPDSIAPTVPANLSGSAVSSTQINLSWSASTDNIGVAGYKIFRSGIQIATSTGASYSDNNLVPSTSYTYTVSAFDAGGNTSPQSLTLAIFTLALPDTISPTTSITSPAGNTVVAGTVIVSAIASDNVGVTKLEFYKDGSLVNTLTTPSTTSTWSWDTRAETNNSHFLQTRSYDAAGNVGASVGVAVTVANPVLDSTPPSVPTNLIGSASSPTQINLTWSTSSDNIQTTGYRIYRSTGSSINTSATSFSLTGLATSTSYSYAVAAYDAAGNLSASSATTTVTTLSGTALTVKVLAPTNGSIVPLYSNLSINVTASDNVKLSTIRIYVDNVLKSTIPVSSLNSSVSTSWSTYTLLPGSTHTIIGTAVDSLGYAATSTAVIVSASTDVDITPPAVTITTPQNGTNVISPLIATASASDAHGIFSIRILVDNAQRGACSNAFYTVTTCSTGNFTLTSGVHSISAIAKDGAGNYATSTISVAGQ